MEEKQEEKGVIANVISCIIDSIRHLALRAFALCNTWGFLGVCSLYFSFWNFVWFSLFIEWEKSREIYINLLHQYINQKLRKEADKPLNFFDLWPYKGDIRGRSFSFPPSFTVLLGNLSNIGGIKWKLNNYVKWKSTWQSEATGKKSRGLTKWLNSPRCRLLGSEYRHCSASFLFFFLVFLGCLIYSLYHTNIY